MDEPLEERLARILEFSSDPSMREAVEALRRELAEYKSQNAAQQGSIHDLTRRIEQMSNPDQHPLPKIEEQRHGYVSVCVNYFKTLKYNGYPVHVLLDTPEVDIEGANGSHVYPNVRIRNSRYSFFQDMAPGNYSVYVSSQHFSDTKRVTIFSRMTAEVIFSFDATSLF